MVGELDRIAEQIQENLAQPQGVAPHGVRYVRGRDEARVQTFFFCPLFHAGEGVLDQLAQVERHPLHGQLAGFDLRQVQDVVDERQQMPPGRCDLAQSGRLVRRGACRQHQVCQTDDGIHGRADFMAHVRQEGALGQIGRLGMGPRLRELDGALVDQLFQVVAVGIEFLPHAFSFRDVVLDRQVMGDTAIGLPDRREDGEFVVFTAVLAAVDELPLPGFTTLQRGPHVVKGGARCQPRVQELGVASDYFLAGVATHAQEGLIDVFDLCIDVGDDDALGALLDRQGQLAQLHVGLDMLGDIGPGTDDGGRGTVRIPQHPQLIAKPDVVTILVCEPVLVPEHVGGGDTGHVGKYAGAVLRVQVVAPPPGRQRLLDGITQLPADVVADPYRLAGPALQGEAVPDDRAGGEIESDLFGVVAHQFDRALALGDVPDDHTAALLAPGVLEQHAGDFTRQARTVLAQERQLAGEPAGSDQLFDGRHPTRVRRVQQAFLPHGPHLGFGPAEHAAGGRVGGQDTATRGQQQDPVDGALENLAKALFASPQRVDRRTALGFTRQRIQCKADIGRHLDQQFAHLVGQGIRLRHIQRQRPYGLSVAHQGQGRHVVPAEADRLGVPRRRAGIGREIFTPERAVFPYGGPGGPLAQRIVRVDRDLQAAQIVGARARLGHRHQHVAAAVDHADPGQFGTSNPDHRITHCGEQLGLGGTAHDRLVALEQGGVIPADREQAAFGRLAFRDVVDGVEEMVQTAIGCPYTFHIDVAVHHVAVLVQQAFFNSVALRGATPDGVDGVGVLVEILRVCHVGPGPGSKFVPRVPEDLAQPVVETQPLARRGRGHSHADERKMEERLQHLLALGTHGQLLVAALLAQPRQHTSRQRRQRHSRDRADPQGESPRWRQGLGHVHLGKQHPVGTSDRTVGRQYRSAPVVQAFTASRTGIPCGNRHGKICGVRGCLQHQCAPRAKPQFVEVGDQALAAAQQDDLPCAARGRPGLDRRVQETCRVHVHHQNAHRLGHRRGPADDGYHEVKVDLPRGIPHKRTGLDCAGLQGAGKQAEHGIRQRIGRADVHQRATVFVEQCK